MKLRSITSFRTAAVDLARRFEPFPKCSCVCPRPILFIAGDRAHPKGFSERAYELAMEPKELYIVEDAEYIDLYDRVDRIPFDKLESFFKENLK